MITVIARNATAFSRERSVAESKLSYINYSFLLKIIFCNPHAGFPDALY